MRLGALSLLLVAACQAEGAIVDREVEFVPAGPGAPESLELPSIARSLLAVDGALLIGTDAGLLLQRGADAPVPIVVTRFSEAEPGATGVIHALAPRPHEGVLVAAEHGLFVWDGQRLARSPVSDVVPAPVRVVSATIGGNEQVAVVGADRSVWWFGPVSSRLAVPASADVIPAIAFVDDALWVSADDTLVRVHGPGGTVELPRELGSGAIRALAGAAGTLWVLAQGGVLRRSGGGESWDRWPIGAVSALTLDPDGAGAWLASDRGALRIGVGAPSFAVHFPPGLADLALDPDGALWGADGAVPRVVRSTGLGAPAPTFEAEVATVAQRACSGCHDANASLPLANHEQWSRNAHRILLELRVGAMPKGSRLPARDLRIVERWVEGGLLP